MPLGFIMTVADHRATGTGCAANPFRPSTVPDQLFGGNGHDTLLGGSGNGNDVLSGGAGSNWGDGNDSFHHFTHWLSVAEQPLSTDLDRL
jgi:Ca2+-binding RTX toxin-like protein